MMQANAKETITSRKITVLIVDDSVTICRFLEATFSEDPGIEVVGYALDPFEARDKIKKLQPDVLTLDVEMPKMDGVTFLKNLMRSNPMPVVMFSSLTDVGASATLDSLEAGAVDFMPKHSTRSGESIEDYIKELVRKVKSAAQVRKFSSSLGKRLTAMPETTALEKKLAEGTVASCDIKRIIAIGASTGGPEALRHVTGALSITDCALVISQHMPENFMESFAKRLNNQCPYPVSIAVDGEKVLPGHGYIAPGGRHLTVEKRLNELYWKVLDGAKVSGHRPSVNVLFRSMATHIPGQTIGVLLTGMGDDGAEGLKALRESGSTTLIQDESSSVVWGMPGSAYSLNAQDETLELTQFAPVINNLLLSLK